MVIGRAGVSTLIGDTWGRFEADGVFYVGTLASLSREGRKTVKRVRPASAGDLEYLKSLDGLRWSPLRNCEAVWLSMRWPWLRRVIKPKATL